MNFLTGFVSIKADDSHLKRRLPGVKRRVKSSTLEMQRRFDRLNFRRASLAVVAFGTAIGGLTYKIIKVAATAVEIDNRFKWVFRHLKEEAASWAESFATNAGRATQEVKNFMNQMQDTLVPVGLSRRAATDLSKTLVSLAYDVASFTDYLDPEVMSNFQSAIVGNVRAVRKYGIFMEKSAMEQEAWSMGIRKSFAALSVQEKVLIRANLLIRGSRDAISDVIRTKMTWVNQMKRVRGNVIDLARKIGERLIPEATKVLILMNEWLQANEDLIAQRIGEKILETSSQIKQAAKWTKEHRDTLLGLAKALVGVYIIKKVAELYKLLGVSALVAKGKVSTLGKILTKIHAPVAALVSALVLLGYGMRKGGKEASHVYKKYNELSGMLDKINPQIGEMADVLERYNKGLKGSGDEALTAAEKTKKFMAQFSPEQIEEGVWTFGAMKGNLEILRRNFGGYLSERTRQSAEANKEDTATYLKFLKIQTRQSQAAFEEAQDNIIKGNAQTSHSALKAHKVYIGHKLKELEFEKGMITKIRDARVQALEGISGKEQLYFEARREQLRATANEWYAMGVPMKITDEWLDQSTQKLKNDLIVWRREFKSAADSIQSSMSGVFAGWMDGSKKFGEGFHEIMGSIVSSVNNAVANMIAAWLRWKIMTMAAGFFDPSGATSQFLSSAAGQDPFAKTGHRGGVVGQITSGRRVSAAAFAGAPKYHGLKSGEQAIIAEKGEVISRPGESGQVAPIIINLQAIDAQSGVGFIMKNKRALAAALGSAVRDNDPFRRQSG